MIQVLSTALLVFAARAINVALGTLRSLLAVRGQKQLAVLLGFFESLVFVLALGGVLGSMSNPLTVLAYSAGFAAGTLGGMLIEEKLAFGYAVLQVITEKEGDRLGEALRDAGHGVTELLGRGRSGEVHVITTVARRRDIPTILERVTSVDASAFVTIDDALNVHRGYFSSRRR